jgi:pimeloyl-ACP methyl ester carboxylesterase
MFVKCFPNKMSKNIIYEDFFLQVNTDRLHCRRISHSKTLQKPIIVFLHEGLGSIPQWKDFPEQVAFRTGLDVFLYERTGYGKSSPLKEKRGLDYLHLEAVQLAKVIHHLGIDDYVLLGHSEGGSIALLHAAEHPPDLKGVITLSANIFHESSITKGILSVRQKFREDNSNLRNALQRFHDNPIDQIFYAWSDTWTSKMFEEFNIKGSLNKVKIPILAMHGMEDEYTTLNQVFSLGKAVEGPVEIVVLDDCGHHPHISQRTKVLDYIVQFLSDAAPSVKLKPE